MKLNNLVIIGVAATTVASCAPSKKEYASYELYPVRTGSLAEMEYAPAALPKYVDIAKAMNVYKDGMSREEAAKAAVDAVKTLSVKVGIPQHLSELGIKEEDLPRLAASAIADVCTPGNPREVTEEIILELYKKAF